MAADDALSGEQFVSRIPRYAIMRSRRVRVMNYEGNNHFTVLDGSRSVFVHRDNLTFIPDRRKTDGSVQRPASGRRAT